MCKNICSSKNNEVQLPPSGGAVWYYSGPVCRGVGATNTKYNKIMFLNKYPEFGPGLKEFTVNQNKKQKTSSL